MFRARDQPESEGLRLLALDGGDIGALSQLEILKELLHRVAWERKLSTELLPCDYFDMMAGVGTGGVIVILLSVLHMEIEEAKEKFIFIWQTVFADDTLDPQARSNKLEGVIKGMLKKKGLLEDQQLLRSSAADGGSLVFVCAAPEVNLGACQKFRSYRSRGGLTRITIVEAIRATCAVPKLFTPVSIEAAGERQNFVTGSFNFNNPARELIKEACDLYQTSRPVACVLSLGCGQRARSSFSDAFGLSSRFNFIEGVAADCEVIADDLHWWIGKSGVYHRFSVDRVLMSPDSSSKYVGEILSHTATYLARKKTSDGMDRWVAVSECFGRITLGDISGMKESAPPSATGLPPLSAFFVERPELINEMARSVLRIGPMVQRRMVISGLGGIGKTQIVLSFLRHFLSRYRHILFLDASSVGNMERDLVAKVKALDSTFDCTTPEDAMNILAIPERMDRDWIIVYDNADEQNLNLAQHFPQCDHGTIIVTTRNPLLGNLAPTAHLEVDLMSESEAVNVILSSALKYGTKITEADRHLACAIAKQLGYLPVALIQLERLEKRRPIILNRPAEAQIDKHYHGVYATLDVTWPNLSARAQRLISLLGFVNYTGFPLPLVERAALLGFTYEPHVLIDRPEDLQRLSEILRDIFQPRTESDDQDTNDLVAELEQYSLVSQMSTFQVTTLRLHPLVHAWVHDRLSAEEQRDYGEAALRLLLCGCGEENQDLFEFLSPHLSILSEKLDTLHANDRGGIADVFAHEGKLALSEKMWESIYNEMAAIRGEEDLRVSEAKLQLARIYWHADVSLKPRAATMEDEVVKLRKQLLPEDDLAIIRAQAQQAHGLYLAGEIKEAERMQHDILRYWQRSVGTNTLAVSQAKEALATTLTTTKARRYSMQLWSEIAQELTDIYGEQHWKTVKATENLAESCISQVQSPSKPGQDPEELYGVAERLWKGVLAARTQSRGPKHPDTLRAMDSVAHCNGWRGMWEEAKEQRESIVTLAKELNGPNHDDTLTAMESLAETYRQSREYAKAEEQWKEILTLRREKLGVAHEETLKSVRTLAGLYFMNDREEDAIIVKKASVTYSTEHHGPNHENTLKTMEELALSYQDFGRFKEAEALWKTVITQRKVRDPEGEDVLQTMECIANMYRRSARYQPEVEQWSEIIAIRKKRHGATHPDTLRCVGQLVLLYEEHDNAVALLKRTILSSSEEHGESHPDTIRVMETLADLYERAEQFEDEENQRKNTVALWTEAYGPSHDNTLKAMDHLADYYWRAGQYEEAVERSKRVISKWTEVYGFDHEKTLQAKLAVAKRYMDMHYYDEAEDLLNEVDEQASANADEALLLSNLVELKEWASIYRAKLPQKQPHRPQAQVPAQISHSQEDVDSTAPHFSAPGLIHRQAFYPVLPFDQRTKFGRSPNSWSMFV